MPFHILKGCVYCGWHCGGLDCTLAFSLYNKSLKPSRFSALIAAHNLEETKGKTEKKERWKSTKKVNCALQALRRDHLSMQNLPVLRFKTHVRMGLQCSCIREPVGGLVSWICGLFPLCLISSRGVVGRGNGHVALPEISQNTSCLIQHAHFLTYPQPFALSLSLWSSFF